MTFVLAPVTYALPVLVEGLRQVARLLLRICEASDVPEVILHPAVHQLSQHPKTVDHALEVREVRLLFSQDPLLRTLLI